MTGHYSTCPGHNRRPALLRQAQGNVPLALTFPRLLGANSLSWFVLSKTCSSAPSLSCPVNGPMASAIAPRAFCDVLLRLVGVHDARCLGAMQNVGVYHE